MPALHSSISYHFAGEMFFPVPNKQRESIVDKSTDIKGTEHR